MLDEDVAIFLGERQRVSDGEERERKALEHREVIVRAGQGKATPQEIEKHNIRFYDPSLESWSSVYKETGFTTSEYLIVPVERRIPNPDIVR